MQRLHGGTAASGPQRGPMRGLTTCVILTAAHQGCAPRPPRGRGKAAWGSTPPHVLHLHLPPPHTSPPTRHLIGSFPLSVTTIVLRLFIRSGCVDGGDFVCVEELAVTEGRLKTCVHSPWQSSLTFQSFYSSRREC